MHLEEFTGNINIEKESIVRDVLNKAISSRGTITGENIAYKYRSSLIIDGERLPSSASVANRCIILPLFSTDKIGNEQKLYEIKKYSFLKDLITRAYSVDADDIVDAYEMAEEKLRALGMNGRALGLNAFALATAILFNTTDVDVIAQKIYDNSQIINSVAGEQDPLSILLSDLILTKRITPKSESFIGKNGDSFRVELPLTVEIRTEKMVDIIGVIRKYS